MRSDGYKPIIMLHKHENKSPPLAERLALVLHTSGISAGLLAVRLLLNSYSSTLVSRTRIGNLVYSYNRLHVHTT